MKPYEILQSSLLDLLFENKNKAYGAYLLRKTYPQRMKKALVFALVLIPSMLYLVANSNFGVKPKLIHVKNEGSIIVTPKDKKEDKKPKEEIKEIAKKQPKANQSGSSSKVPDYTTPKLTSNTDSVSTSGLGNTLDPGDGDPFGGIIPGGGSGGEGGGGGQGGPDTTTYIPEITQNEIVKPSFDAKYKGGAEAMGLYLQEKLEDEAIEEGTDKKITVKFWIEADGAITNVTTENCDDKEFAQKATKAFLKMKKWQPAVNSGNPIRVFKVISVTIVAPEN